MAETNLFGLYKFYISEFVFTGFYTEAKIGNGLVRSFPYISVLNLCINAKAGEIAGNYILIIASFQISSKRIFLSGRQSENNISGVLMSSPYFFNLSQSPGTHTVKMIDGFINAVKVV